MIKNIIFDFDGVLVASVDIKTAAFGELFKNFPDEKDEIVKFHVDNGGMSRFDKFRYVYKNIFKEPLSDDEFNRLCKDFSNLVVEKVVKAPFVKGALEFLQKNLDRYNMFVASGTPEEEIRDIITMRNMDKYFLGAYGSPKSKEELLLKILEENNYPLIETIFIGDSINDYKAASETGVKFVAMVKERQSKWNFKGIKIEAKVNDLFEFDRWLEAN